MTAIPRSKIPPLPPAIEGLAQLIGNLSWSWNREARTLFRTLDEVLWHECRHNPIRFLNEIEPERLARAAADPAFTGELGRVLGWMEQERSNEHTWFGRTWPELRTRPVAYFCAEFGLHNSVPIYSGGLGILAGDHCKAASDLGVPLVALGLFYQKGYFDQRIDPGGWQKDGDQEVDADAIPVRPLVGLRRAAYVTVVETFGRPVYVRAWAMEAGRVPVYLLDTTLERNHPDDRALLNRLYGEGEDLRLRQEWILGVGGVRVLRALGVEPAVWHANEGHASFMLLERLRELVAQGATFDDALAAVRAVSVFTTHTPVPAGHDNFDAGHVAACTGPVWEQLGISKERFFALAAHPTRNHGRFDMTAFALRLSGRVNGVSRRHGAVSRAMWHALWPERAEDEVPIGAVTNGVHTATWMANPMMALLDQHLGTDWWTRLQDPEHLDGIARLDDADLWQVHVRLKNALFRFIREDARRRFAEGWTDVAQVLSAGGLLDPNAFTIGFARRFATYKRADLVFRDRERLQRLLVDARRPVQLVFAGKAHPADTPGKQVLQNVYRFTHDPFYEGRVAFVEDYGMYPALMLVRGVDLWLNLPRVPLEASGTSGMKAGLNAVPQLSTLDGWWEEGFDGTNGWAIARSDAESPEAADAHDADALYRLLEEQVIPLYYDRDARGVPVAWVDRMRNALRVAASRFTAHRMVCEYAERHYVPAMRGDVSADVPPTS